MHIDSLSLGRNAKVASDVYIDFPADAISAPTWPSCARMLTVKARATASKTSC